MSPSKSIDNEKASSPTMMEYTRTSPLEHPRIHLTDEQYERLFLQPGGQRKGHLAARFANPTPLAIICFLLVLTPTSMYLLQWDGSAPSSTPVMIGPYYFLGGLGMMVAAVGEWILGNTFPFVVFFTFGGFWASQGTINDASKLIATAFAQGTASRDYNAGMEFYYIFWAVLCAIYGVAALRTNIVFVVIFVTLFFAFSFFAAGYHSLGVANTMFGLKLLKAAGGFAFVTCVAGWYLFAGLIFASTDLPFVLPFGDLTGFLRPKTAR